MTLLTIARTFTLSLYLQLGVIVFMRFSYKWFHQRFGRKDRFITRFKVKTLVRDVLFSSEEMY